VPREARIEDLFELDPTTIVAVAVIASSGGLMLITPSGLPGTGNTTIEGILRVHPCCEAVRLDPKDM
jgi:hypothetical protein